MQLGKTERERERERERWREGRAGGMAGGRGREEELLRALGGFSVVVPHKCIQALQDEPLTGMRDGEHERRGEEEEAAAAEEDEEEVVCGVEVGQSCQTPGLNRDVIYCRTHVSLLERH